MAKEAPSFTVLVDDSGGTGRQLENDITNFDFSTPRAVQDTTGVDNTAIQRLLLLADFSATFSGVFNDASNKSHDVFKTVCSATVTRTVTMIASGQTLTNEVLLTDYPFTRATTGELTWAVPAVLQSGVVPTWS
jgi:hypothetical protein